MSKRILIINFPYSKNRFTHTGLADGAKRVVYLVQSDFDRSGFYFGVLRRNRYYYVGVIGVYASSEIDAEFVTALSLRRRK